MARPTKKGLEYFPLDCHMSDEVNLIIADFGIEGYGVLISMFQSIYGDKGYYTEWTNREQKLFSRKVGLPQEKVVSIISECVDWGIFNKKKYEELNILTSRRIQDHYSTSTYKRVGVEMKKEYLMIDISEKKHINNIVSDDGNKATTMVSDGESTQSTVQYSKVNNNTDKYLENHQEAIKLNSEYDSIETWKAYPNKKGKVVSMKKIPKILKKVSKEKLLLAIKNYDKSVIDKKYLMHGSTFFNGGYEDYIDLEKEVKQVNNNGPKNDESNLPQWVLDKMEGEK